MLIIGAKGFAKEVLEIVFKAGYPDISFFDDINIDTPDHLYGKFKVLKNINQAQEYFEKKSKHFTLGIGNPFVRYEMYKKMTAAGGIITSVISPDTSLGSFGTSIFEGVNIMQGVRITNEAIIEKACLINLNCTIGHNSVIGQFSELSPGANISGNCTVGEFCNIGTNATLLPGITLGKNVIVGAGAVVTKNFSDDVTVIGIPGRIK